mgnify:FL=1
MEMDKKKNNLAEFWESNKRSFGVVVILLTVAYGMKIFHLAISHDTEAVISVPDNMYFSWIAMGRFGLVAIKYLLGLEVFNPYLAAVLAFLMLVINSIFWEYLFWKITVYKKNFSKVSWIFPAMFLTAPIMADQFSFLLQAFEVQLAVLFVGIALFLIYNPSVSGKGCVLLKMTGACALLILSFSCYQSTVPLFIAGTCSSFLLMYPALRHKWRALFKAVACFAVSFILYEVVSKLVMWCMNIPATEYISDQIFWGQRPFRECVMNILRHIKQVLTGEGIFFSISYLLAFIMLFLLLVYKVVKKREEVPWLLLASATLMATPFLMSIVLGQAPTTRVQIVLPFVFGFVFQFFFLQWDFRPALGSRVGAAAGIAILALCLEQCVWDARIYYTEYVVYDEDVRLAEKISDRIDQLNLGESPEEPVVFVGSRIPALNPSAYAHISMSGYSFFEISFSTAHGTWVMRNFMMTLGYNYKYPSDEQFIAAEEYAKTMESWPNTNSVAVHDGMIIVKLSD